MLEARAGSALEHDDTQLPPVIDLRLQSVEEAHEAVPGDQAAALRRACGHARGEVSLVDAGFRFYAMPAGSELPSFLNRRLTLADGRTAAITLLAGVDPASGEEVLTDCASTADARAELDAGRGGLWLVRLTLGNATVGWGELTSRLARQDPSAFTALASALLALPLETRRQCPSCSRS